LLFKEKRREPPLLPNQPKTKNYESFEVL